MTAIMDRPLQRPKWRSKPVTAAAAATAVLLAAGVMSVGFFARGGASLRVASAGLTIETVRKDTFHDFTPLQGKVTPRDTIYLDALEGGQVERLLVQAGDRVAEGQPLIVFRNTQLELEVLDREGRLIESITQLQSYEKQLEQNRAANENALQTIDYNILRLTRSADRRDDLASKGYLSREEQDKVRDELEYNRKLRPVQVETNRRQEELRRGQVPQIRAELASLQQSLRLIRAKLDDLTVRAPIAGRLTVLDLKIGENRARGARLAEIVPDTGYKVAADVDEYYLGRVRDGQTAAASMDGTERTLKVSRIYPQVKDGVFTIDLEFAGPAPQRLTPGEAIQGRLSLGGDRPALILPAGAFLDRSGGDWVFVVDEGGRRAERRRVKLGRRNAEQVEVLEGLQPGERVVTSDYSGFEKMDRLEISR